MMQIGRKTKLFDVINAVIMGLLSLLFLLPFWVVIVSSVISPREAALFGSYQLITLNPDFGAYRVLLDSGSAIYKAYGVTIFIVVVGTSLNLLFTSFLAYGISKRDLPGRKLITFFIFFTMLFSGGLIPNYLLVTALGLLDTLWALVLPGLVSAWNTLLMRNFFMTIPESLEESALIDGASPIGVLFRIILPLSLASIATVGLFYAVGHWNAWFGAALYINDKSKYPLQIILRNLVLSMSNLDINNEMMVTFGTPPPATSMKSAAIIVTTIPILFIYPFVQKYFVKGVLVGSVKG